MVPRGGSLSQNGIPSGQYREENIHSEEADSRKQDMDSGMEKLRSVHIGPLVEQEDKCMWIHEARMGGQESPEEPEAELEVEKRRELKWWRQDEEREK